MSDSPAIKRLGKALRAVTDNGDPAGVVAFARAHNVDGRAARRAAKDIDVNVSAYLQLCAALGLDPLTGGKVEPERFSEIDWRLVGLNCCMVLIAKSYSVRQAAKKWRMSSAAVNRLRNAQAVSVDTFLAFCKARDVAAKPTKFRKREPMFHDEQSVKQMKRPKQVEHT